MERPRDGRCRSGRPLPGRPGEPGDPATGPRSANALAAHMRVESGWGGLPEARSINSGTDGAAFSPMRPRVRAACRREISGTCGSRTTAMSPGTKAALAVLWRSMDFMRSRHSSSVRPPYRGAAAGACAAVGAERGCAGFKESSAWVSSCDEGETAFCGVVVEGAGLVETWGSQPQRRTIAQAAAEACVKSMPAL
jgi:hypothetical protein